MIRLHDIFLQIVPDSLPDISPGNVAQSFHLLDWNEVMSNLANHAVSFSLRVVAAIALFYVGRFVINKIHALTRAIMIKRDFDRSLATFLLSLIKFTLLFVLVIAVIGILGIETSSFIALFASAGVAVGMALSGTLQNFAGGVIILLLKPYKIGDFIEYESYKGTVREIQIFHTVITTLGNERIIIPNGGLSTGIINNYSAEKYRRIEWRVGISYGDDVESARRAIMDMFNDDPRVVKTEIESSTVDDKRDNSNPDVADRDDVNKVSWWRRLFCKSKAKAQQWKTIQQETINSKILKIDTTPQVVVESLDDSAVTLVARAWCSPQDFWPLTYDINEKIYVTLPRCGIRFPFPQLDVHMTPS